MQSWATSTLFDKIAKSLVFVLRAESEPFNFFKQTSSKNFLAKVTELIYYPVLNGITKAPLLNNYLASSTVKSS